MKTYVSNTPWIRAAERIKWETLYYGIKEGTLHNMFSELGSPWFDFEQFQHRAISGETLRNFEPYCEHAYEMDPDVVSYWENYEKGLKKEIHEPYNLSRKWASYVPLSAVDNPDRRYPLLFVMHGGGNSIYLTETYGHMHMAARHEVIVVAPENETQDAMLALYHDVLDTLPVDPSRIYITGFSYGSAMSGELVTAHPELFAGVCLGGQYLRNHYGITPTQKQIEKINHLTVPLINIAGTTEFGRVFPMSMPSPHTRMPPNVDKTVEANHEGLNQWLRATGCCREVTLQEILDTRSSSNEVERELGAPFDESYTLKMFDNKYYFGKYLNADGECRMQLVGIDNVPHWPVAQFSEIMWEFFSQYSRNPETKLIEHRSEAEKQGPGKGRKM